nr:hypothetical protein [Tanacetum cinerariifolium]
MKKIIKEQVKAQVSKIMPQIKNCVTESLGAEVLVRSTNQSQTSYAVETSLSEFKLKKILIDKMETNESINRLDNHSKESIQCNVPADYFINNDLEYLKGRSSSSKYTISTTRTKAAKYKNIKGIEDMKSPHDVYSKRRIIAVTSVKVMRWYDYGYLEEIVVKRDDNMLYKFKEGDFLRLNLCDIKDMLLLLVQKKLSNLEIDDRYDLGVALQMFTRRIVILHRVEDLQLELKAIRRSSTSPDQIHSDQTF